MVDYRNMTMGERMRVERRKLIASYSSPSVTNEGYQEKEVDEIVVNTQNMSMKERMIAEGFCPCFYGSWQCCMNPDVKHSSPPPTTQLATDLYSPLILFPEHSNVPESGPAPQLITSQSILQDELVVEKCTRLDPLSELLQDFPELHSCSSSYIDETVVEKEDGLLVVLMANGYNPTTEELKELKLEGESRSIVEIQSGSTLIPEDVDIEESNGSFLDGYHSVYSIRKTIYSDPFDVSMNEGYIRVSQVDFKGDAFSEIHISAKYLREVTTRLLDIIFTFRGVNNWLTLLIRGTYSTDFSYRQLSVGDSDPTKG